VVCFNRVVRVLLDGVQGRGDQLIENPRVDVRAVGRNLGRDSAGAQRLGEEAPRRPQVTPHGQQDVDDLAMLIDGPVEIAPLTCDLQVGLVGEPPVFWDVAARSGSLDELRGEALHPPLNADMINGYAALGQQLLDIPVRQAIAQVPPDRDRDHIRREPEASEDRGRAMCSHRTSLRPSAIDQRNSARLRYLLA
jgi:hypothetical protein